MFKRIDHIELVTARPERAVAFYTGVLGFRVRSRTSVPATPLGPLEVDDMDAALAYLAGKGVECTWGPKKRPDYARAEIRDPDGNSIELRQWIDAR